MGKHSKPEFQVGDVIRCDDHGGTLIRSADGRWLTPNGDEGLGIRGCDVTLLVRDGKAVR